MYDCHYLLRPCLIYHSVIQDLGIILLSHMNFYRADRLPQPPVALMQWQNEINEYTNGKLRVLIHHNSNPKIKNMKLKELRGFDIIMISYSGLESVYRKESKGWKRDDGLIKENSKIHAIKYHRLILDEAHNIKTRTTGGMKYT